MDVKSTDEETQEEAQFHVLAVDDSSIDRKVLEKLLRVSSYQVTCVESGDKALEYLGLVDDLDGSSFHPASSSLSTKRLQGAKVNLIMTDYCMPGMSGYDLLKRLKGSSCKDVPVVVMSSENIPARINMCMEGGAEEFLLKPLQLSDVKKLQPHLLKSMVSHSCTCKEPPKNGGKMTLIRTTATSSMSNNNNNKRKASSPEPAERRLKVKETYS